MLVASFCDLCDKGLEHDFEDSYCSDQGCILSTKGRVDPVLASKALGKVGGWVLRWLAPYGTNTPRLTSVRFIKTGFVCVVEWERV